MASKRIDLGHPKLIPGVEIPSVGIIPSLRELMVTI
jgi:hypothetical protein